MYVSKDSFQYDKNINVVKNVINSIKDAHCDLLVTYATAKRKKELSLALQNTLNSTSLQISDFLAQKIINNPEIATIKQSFKAVFGEVEAQVEKNYLESFKNYKDIKKDLYEYFFYGDYDSLIDDEIELLKKNNIDTTKEIALIGAGSIPMTAILLHKRTGAKITCVDMDEKACELSRNLIKNLDLSESIIIEKSESSIFDYSKFNTVLIASLINNKKELLRSLSNFENINAIIIRSAKKLAKLIYEEVSKDMIKNLKYEIIDNTKDNESTLHLSMLVKSTHPCGCSNISGAKHD
jgi:precorrin-6B methylase 2